MATEIEVKVRIADPVAAERAIAALSATYQGQWLEIDTFYDHPDERLRQGDSALRMRVDQPLDDPARQARRAVVLAYKGPRQESRLKVRAEHQVDIPEPQAMIEILRGLHYTESFSYEKRRQRWRLGDAEITIDELPHLGFFMEVEAASEDEVERILDRLGFRPSEHITKSYLHLLFDHFDGRPEQRFIRFDGV